MENGGTVGDIESLPFLETIRQMRIEIGEQRSIFIHLTLVPYIGAAGELKTKPTQHSVKELRSIGIQPDILLCRSERVLPDGERRKIALFTNVHERAVISCSDADSTYRIPRMLHEQGLTTWSSSGSDWNRSEAISRNGTPSFADSRTRAGTCGSRWSASTSDSRSPTSRSAKRWSTPGSTPAPGVDISYIDSEEIERAGTGCLEGADAVLVPGGFGRRGIGGKVQAVRYARENKVPYLGICLGMQVAVIEYARHRAGIADADSTEFNRATPHPVIALVTDVDRQGRRARAPGRALGARRDDAPRSAGDQAAARVANTIGVRCRHHQRAAPASLRVQQHLHGSAAGCGTPDRAGKTIDGTLVEVVEIPDHPWFIGCQFHPEFKSTPRDGHPLFNGFIEAASNYRARNDGEGANGRSGVSERNRRRRRGVSPHAVERMEARSRPHGFRGIVARELVSRTCIGDRLNR